MPAVVVARADDEIADLIDRVRSAGEPDVGLVVPASSHALQTPLNVRLLAQFSNQSGRRTAIVCEDPRIQQLARASGMQVYGSVPAYERGIELTAPRVSVLGQGRSVALGTGTGAAAAVLDLPPPPPAPPPVAPTAPAPARLEPRRVITQLPPPRPKRGWDRRRLLYFAGAAVAIIGILVFMTLSPSAKVTITIAATPLSVNSTIQGSTNANLANTPDHVLTGVVSSQASQTFQASPTGTKTIPASAARATVVFSTNKPFRNFALPAGETINNSDQSVAFVVTRYTVICIGANATSTSCVDPNSGQPASPNSNAPVQDTVTGAVGNVPGDTLTVFPGGSPFADITVTNPSPATGGVDPRQVTAASATDVSNWTAQVQQIEAVLTGQLNTDMQDKASGKTFAVDPAGNGKSVVFATTPTSFPPQAGAQFTATTISISATAHAATYDPVSVKNAVIADLDKLVKPGDELAPNKPVTPQCSVTQANTNGTIVLACSATDFSQPTVNLNSLKSKLTGRNPGSAAQIIKSNLAKVQNVHVSMSPFQLFYLPLFPSKIEIDESFVAPASSSP